MKRLAIVIGLGLVAVATMAARPGTEQQLVQQLSGQPVRWVMPDGGKSGAFAAAASVACMPLTGARNAAGASIAPNVLLFVPLTAVNVCVQPSVVNPSWDGGCNVLPGDINYGWPLPAGVPQYITPDSVAHTLCFLTDAGSVVQPVGWAE